MIDICKLLINGVIAGTISVIELALLLAIIIAMGVVLYKNNRYFKIAYNFAANVLPFVKRKHILVVNFAKQKGAIGEIKEKYVEAGCKTFVLNKNTIEANRKVDEASLTSVVKEQERIIVKAKGRMKDESSFIYAGFPHIPLGFLDGMNFTDSDVPMLYENQHADADHRKKGFYELEKVYNTEMRLCSNIGDLNEPGKEVALKIEQSFRISDDEVKAVLKDVPIVSLSNEIICRSGISNYSQIDKYKKEFEKILAGLRAKGVERVHLFATTPTSLSFSLGSVIKHYHPEIIVYNFNNGVIDWALNLRTKTVIAVNPELNNIE